METSTLLFIYAVLQIIYISKIGQVGVPSHRKFCL